MTAPDLLVEAIAIWVAPIEYVSSASSSTTASGSDRHLRDVAMMFRISGELVDPQALDGWERELGLQEIAAAARPYQSPGA